MPRKFKATGQQAVYAEFMANRPSSRQQGGLGSAFSAGYENPDAKAKHVRNSLAYAAWAAGVDCRRADAVEVKKNWLIDRETECRLSGFAEKEAKEKAMLDWHTYMAQSA